jgi:isopentenyl-diphosphate delta-isomerase
VVGDGLIEHERVQMFVGKADRARLKIVPDPNEVSETRWAAPAVLREEMAARPEVFTPCSGSIGPVPGLGPVAVSRRMGS